MLSLRSFIKIHSGNILDFLSLIIQQPLLPQYIHSREIDSKSVEESVSTICIVRCAFYFDIKRVRVSIFESIGRVSSSRWSSKPFRAAKCGTRGPSPGNLWRRFEQNEEKRTSLPVERGVPATGRKEGDRGEGEWRCKRQAFHGCNNAAGFFIGSNLRIHARAGGEAGSRICRRTSSIRCRRFGRSFYFLYRAFLNSLLIRRSKSFPFLHYRARTLRNIISSPFL